MSYEVANVELGHKDIGEESSAKTPPTPQNIAPILSDNSRLSMPTDRFPLGHVSSGPEEIWVPHQIHTALCDRCGQHNKSVIQRSSRENKQFCKLCMHLNVSDGIYSVNVEQLDWTSHAIPCKRRVRVASNPSKLKQAKKPLVSPGPTILSRRRSKEHKKSANKSGRLAAQPERECRNADSLSVAEVEVSDKREDTEDNISSIHIASGGTLPSKELGEPAVDPGYVDETAKRLSTHRNGERTRKSKRRKLGMTTKMDIMELKVPPWWELTLAPTSSARVEPPKSLEESNIHLHSSRRRRSDCSPEAVVAADILLNFAQNPLAI